MKRLIVCYECSSMALIDMAEYLEHTGKIVKKIIEPCGDHKRIVIYHKPLTPTELDDFEAKYQAV